jgi:predicted GNAT family N-acyltransferase
MKLFNSFDEISPIVRKHFKVGVSTNVFLSESEYRALIDKNRLFYEEFNGGLLLFKKRENDYLCYYQITDLNLQHENLFEADGKLPIVVELVSKSVESQNNMQNFFESYGFKKNLERMRMKKKEQITNNAKSEFAIKYADPESETKIVQFLKQSFDGHTGCIPSQDELEKDINNKFVITAFDGDKVIGVLHFKNDKNKSEIRHLAIDKEYRHQNIASALMCEYLKETKELNSSVWVRKDNDEAVKLYQKFGYKADGFSSVVLIKEG